MASPDSQVDAGPCGAADRPVTVVFNVMYERWEEGVAPGLGPMGNPLAREHLDLQAISWSRYGSRTGVWRLLELYEDFGIQASFFTSAILCETDPESILAVHRAGHELCGHSWAQNVVPATLTKDAERAVIARSTTAIESLTGQRPVGWISPRCTPSVHTTELLRESGYLWFGDVFDSDLPYREAEGDSLVMLPFGLEVNDLPLTIRYGQPDELFVANYEAAVAARKAERQPGFLDVTVHAHIGARPRGLAALRTVLERATADPRVRIATRTDVAREAG